ncbi:tyrosine-type recombinase/integrase [Metabacillus fastidiosus]|uniref:tyrosine-type recombinase/integrase n=1 Tax=Metabacillus fastidiosus TaxID=1458 RepID=UPI003D2DF8DF
MPIYPYDKGGKEHWYYAFEVKDHNGKRKTIKKRGFKGKTEARNAEAAARTEWNKGTYIDPSTLLYKDYVTDWLKNKQDISDKTRITNEGHIKNHINPILGEIPLQKINIMHIEKFIQSMQEKGLSQGTVKKIFNFVQTSFNSAYRKEIIAKNPFALLDKSSKPRPGRARVDYWTKEEIKIFLESVDHRNKIIFILAIYTGMRQGEILGLRWRDVDFENAQIRIRQTLDYKGEIQEKVKTDAGYRSISASESLLAELKKHRTLIEKEKLAAEEYFDHDLVVCRKNGRPTCVTNFHRFWKRRTKKVNVRQIRFHDLRHTCASLLLSSNIHPKIVQEMLGHSSIKVTMDTYSHLMPNMQKDAVAALDELLK